MGWLLVCDTIVFFVFVFVFGLRTEKKRWYSFDCSQGSFPVRAAWLGFQPARAARPVSAMDRASRSYSTTTAATKSNGPLFVPCPSVHRKSCSSSAPHSACSHDELSALRAGTSDYSHTDTQLQQRNRQKRRTQPPTRPLIVSARWPIGLSQDLHCRAQIFQ